MPEHLKRFIDHDTRHPASQRTLALGSEVAQTFEDLQVALLQDVLHILLSLQIALADGGQVTKRGAIQLLHRFTVAFLNVGDKMFHEKVGQREALATVATIFMT